MMTFKLVHLAVGLPEEITYESNKQMNSAICKKEIESVSLKTAGFEGDGVADLKHHGGVERAVCFYPLEHYETWNRQFNTELPPAAFGENIMVEGMCENDVCIGDIYQIGDAVVAVTQGRVPCVTIDRRTGANGLFKEIMQTGSTGYFAKVLREGTIHKDSAISLVSKHKDHISVLTANQLFFQQKKDLDLLTRLLQNEHLSEKWYAHFSRIKERFN
ncbi:MOSC domain-containing protein [Alkalicoccobacillus porphyridii]|uniref:MOSC domain-containing protein n=1 Tax=Alkalicoccobacillus porphyridii TaxID=2597270 RepID=A0A554A0A4_9BACI|nr:MOSC domain-containing protein [Alkalicoccobacillus porphyridii]TSB47103.1 MOSC domain-containing protein [Alkalicoccobacillus porphyridii]